MDIQPPLHHAVNTRYTIGNPNADFIVHMGIGY